MRQYYRAGGDTHVTKEGKTAKKVFGTILLKRKNVEKKCVKKVLKGHPLRKQLKQVKHEIFL